MIAPGALVTIRLPSVDIVLTVKVVPLKIGIAPLLDVLASTPKPPLTGAIWSVFVKSAKSAPLVPGDTVAVFRGCVIWSKRLF